MAEVAINLKGQDNLTQTVKNAKKAVDDLKYSSTELGKCSKEFDSITNSGKSLKTQLRQLQQLMANMNLKGLSNTDEFTKIAMAAGEIKDAMADATDAMNRFASDTAKLDAFIQGVQGVAAATSIATGAMGLFGTENEKVQRAILKVQSAMAILNGVQQIANVLNKDSALMQQIKAIKLAATTKTTVANTVATAANTAAQKTNTTAIVANTAAQKAWNMTKAISKALFGDFTGLVLVGVTAVAAYAIATDDAADKQKELNDEVDKGADKQNNYKKVMVDTYASLMTSYAKLKKEWNGLKTTHEKNQWILDNKAKLEELEISVNKAADAERAVNGNTSAVVEGMIKRAKAAARLAELTDLYRKQMELIDKRTETIEKINGSSQRNTTGHIAMAGQPIPQGTGNYSSTYGQVNAIGQWVFTEQGARNWNNGIGDQSETVRKIDEQIEKTNQQINKVAQMIGDDVKSRGKATTNAPRTSGKTTATVDKVNFAKGSLDDLNSQLDAAKKRLTSGLFQNGETQDSIIQLIADLQKQVNAKKIELGLELSDEAKKTLEIQRENARKLEKANEEFNNLNTTYTEKTSSYDKVVKKTEEANGYVTTNQGKLDTIREEMDFNDDLIAQLEDLKAAYDALGDTDGLKKVNDALGEVKATQEVLSAQVGEITQKNIEWEKQKQSMQGVADTAGEMGNAFGSLGQVFSAVGDESAAAVMQMVTATLDGVAQVIPQIMKLIAAKQGEAMAEGTASAAKLKFPANIAAIATVIATITSTFAGIIAAAQKFADGGIVGGGSLHGDRLLARVNSGEMILNGKQQQRLFDLLDGNGAIGGAQNQVITWKLRGTDIYGSLKNLSNIKSKVGKQIL